jgi:hypothetical protein
MFFKTYADEDFSAPPSDVYRPTNSRLINMDTRFAHAYNDDSTEYTFQLSERISRVRSIQIVSVEIPKSFTNFSVGRNSISFEVSTNQNFSSDSTDTIIIPSAQYDLASDLIDAINTKIANLDTGNPATFLTFEVTKDDFKTRRCIITSSASSFLYIRFLSTTDSVKYTPVLQQCLGWKLGYRVNTYALAPGAEWISSATIDLWGPRYALLVLDSLNSSSTPGIQVQFSQSTMAKQVVAKIPLVNNTYMDVISVNRMDGGLISETIHTAGPDCTGGAVFHRMRVQLCDEFGNPLDHRPMDYSFVIKVESQ